VASKGKRIDRKRDSHALLFCSSGGAHGIKRISETEFAVDKPISTFFALDCFERLRDALKSW
jgi:hypothetical protein